MPTSTLRNFFGFSRPATIPADGQQSGGAGPGPANAILYPDVLTQETWKKRQPAVTKLFGDFKMGERLNKIQEEFQELELHRDLPSIDAGLVQPEAFLSRLKEIKQVDGYPPLFNLLDLATADAAGLDEAISASSLATSASRDPATDVMNALLELKRQVTERAEVIDRMPDEFRRKLEQDPVFKTMRTTCESVSPKSRLLIDAIGQIRGNPTVAQVREKFQEGSTGNPARDIVSTVTFWNQIIVKRWPGFAAQVFSDIKTECIDEALSYAGSLRMTRDLVASERQRQEKIDAIEKAITTLETAERESEEKEILARQELSDVEKLTKQSKSAAADDYLLNAGPDYPRAKYAEKIRNIDAAADLSITSRRGDIQELNKKITELRALTEGKKQEIEYLRAQEKTEVLEQMDKLQGSLPGVASLVAGYESFWDMVKGEIGRL